MSDFASDVARGRWDVEFFALRFLGIRLNPGQKRLAKAYLKRTKSGWRAAYLWIMAAAGNRAGKTLGLAIIVFHSCFYKLGQEPPTDLTSEKKVRHWLETPYVWYHFGLEKLLPRREPLSGVVLLQGAEERGHLLRKAGESGAGRRGGHRRGSLR